MTDEMLAKPAQAEILLTALAATTASQEEDFFPGEFVEFIPGLGTVSAEARAKFVLLFWRYLQTDNYIDQQVIRDAVDNSSRVIFPDCVLAHVIGDEKESQVKFVVCASADLQKLSLGATNALIGAKN